MNADGTDQRQLTTGWGHARFPDYSPDGSAIVYELAVGALDQRAVTTIYVLDLDTGSTSPVVQFGDQASTPSWADDGRQIVFTRNGPDGIRTQLYIMNSDGTNATALTSSAANSRWPVVSSDYR